MANTIRTPLPVYTTGTVSGNAGQPVLTGVNTSWIAMDSNGNAVNTVMGGDLFIAGDRAIPIRSVDSATQITLECPLPTSINAGTAYRIVKISPNLSGGVTAALAILMAMGTDASPYQSLAVDSGAGRVKLRVAANGNLQLAVGPAGASDAALVTALNITQAGAVGLPAGLPRTTVADANYAVVAGDRTVAFTALTAARTVSLPPANGYPTGTQLLIVDETGACSPSNAITVTRAGSDTINGAPSYSLASPYGFVALMSNGNGAWTLVDFAGALAPQLGNGNIIINGNFAINQRAYASGATLAAGAYAHDRWKAGASGGAYSINQGPVDTSITITSGSLLQVVDGANMPASSCWLTWTGTAQVRVYAGQPASATSPAYAAGTPITIGGVTVNALALTGLAVGNNTSVEFANGTLGLVKLEAAIPGAGPTRFERRLLGLELLLCQRYWQVSNAVVANLFQANTINAAFPYTVTMRATPTISLLSGAGKVDRPNVASYDVTGIASVFGPGVQSACVQLTTNGTSTGPCEIFPGVLAFSAEL